MTSRAHGRWPRPNPAALALAASFIAAAPAAASFATPRQWKCVGKQFTITNSNTDAVENGGAPATFSTGGQTLCVLQIDDYHWNGGQGATPGTVGLTVVSGLGGARNTVGPLAAVGSAGQ